MSIQPESEDAVKAKIAGWLGRLRLDPDQKGAKASARWHPSPFPYMVDGDLQSLHQWLAGGPLVLRGIGLDPRFFVCTDDHVRFGVPPLPLTDAPAPACRWVLTPNTDDLNVLYDAIRSGYLCGWCTKHQGPYLFCACSSTEIKLEAPEADDAK